MNKPLITIIIPCIRSILIKNSIRSLLLQDVEILQKCELILILNFQNKEKINFSLLFKDFKQEEKKILKKIKIFRKIYTKKFLNLRDNWEFSTQHITGRWTLFLCDDDALIPSALKVLYQFITQSKSNVICFDIHHITYDHSKNVLKYFPQRITNLNTKVFNSSNYINKVINLIDLVGFGLKKDLPYFPKVICNSKIIARHKPFFISHDPMTSSFFSLLYKEKNFLKINQSLLIMGEDPHSLSSSHKNLKNYNFWKKNLTNDIYKYLDIYLKDLRNFDYSKFIISWFFNLVHVASKKFNFKILNIKKQIYHFLMGLCKEAIRRNTFFSNKNSVSYNREIFKVYYFIFKKYNIPLFLLFLFKVEFYRYLKNIKLLRTLLHNGNSVTELKFKNIYEAAKYLKK
jgi:hypothetical protein